MSTDHRQLSQRLSSEPRWSRAYRAPRVPAPPAHPRVGTTQGAIVHQLDQLRRPARR